MTKIAASPDPKAHDLFRSIMIASAAIPGAFPPTMIDVEANGRPCQEMHVDGGTMSQVFVYPSSLRVKETSRKHHATGDRRAYVIRSESNHAGFLFRVPEIFGQIHDLDHQGKYPVLDICRRYRRIRSPLTEIA